MRRILKNVRPFYQEEAADCVIEDGKIVAFEKAGSIRGNSDDICDCAGLILLPGIVDSHVHFRTPGEEQKEDWQSGSAAALFGGVTTVLDMPNNIVPITTKKLLEEKIAFITEQKPKVHFGCYIGATDDNLDEVVASQDIACGVKVYMGKTTGDLVMNNQEALQKLCAANLSIPIVVHAEDDAIIAQHASATTHAERRPREAAVLALQRVLAAMRKTSAKVHITHIATRDEVELIAAAKQEGLDITCDVTPHHLLLFPKFLKKLGNYAKVNPPIRGKDDNDALWHGLEDGVIDMIASDHAPHLLSEKQQDDEKKVPSGIPGVETLFPLMLNNLGNAFSLSKIVMMTATAPAERFGLKDRGRLAVGARADLVLVNISKEHRLTREGFHSKAGWSPWEGEKLRGSIEKVLVDGEIVVDTTSALLSSDL